MPPGVCHLRSVTRVDGKRATRAYCGLSSAISAFRRQGHRMGRVHPETKGCTLCVSSPPRKCSSTCVAARLCSGSGGSRHSGRCGLDPLLSPPREEGRCLKDRGAFRRFGVRARERDCSLSPTRASPRSRRPALGHCSGGQRLCDHPAWRLALTSQALTGGSNDRSGGLRSTDATIRSARNDFYDRISSRGSGGFTSTAGYDPATRPNRSWAASRHLGVDHLPLAATRFYPSAPETRKPLLAKPFGFNVGRK